MLPFLVNRGAPRSCSRFEIARESVERAMDSYFAVFAKCFESAKLMKYLK